MIDWATYLTENEALVWQGRPAPRCFTFRRWKLALFGVVVLALSIWWQFAGWQMVQQQGAALFLLLLPLPFVLIGLYLSVGHLVRARLEWERVFYALTSQRLLIQCGVFKSRIIALPVEQLSYQCLTMVGYHLGNLYVEAGQRRLTLCCVEYPQQLYQLLEPIILTNNGADSDVAAEDC